MMPTKIYFISFCVFLISCTKQKVEAIISENTIQSNNAGNSSYLPGDYINKTGNTIESRFLLPKGFSRTKVENHSFGNYLRNLPLKPYGTTVKYYNGQSKTNHNVYCSVVDMPISNKDLQQCADAVMRLIGEYQFQEKKYSEIQFNFLSDGKPRKFSTYAKGNYSYENFLKYMEYVFNYANTGSLHDELKTVSSLKDIKIGDAYIEKKQPYGHAVTVVDVIENQTGEKLFLLAQSYMPAQETQILINPKRKDISPWYSTKNLPIITPEWQFEEKHLKRRF